jgi:hypothetical protein
MKYATCERRLWLKDLLLSRMGQICGHFSPKLHKIIAGNKLIPKGGFEECDCHALNWLIKLANIFLCVKLFSTFA